MGTYTGWSKLENFICSHKFYWREKCIIISLSFIQHFPRGPCDSWRWFRRHKENWIQEENKGLALSKKQAELKDHEWHEEMMQTKLFVYLESTISQYITLVNNF